MNEKSKLKNSIDCTDSPVDGGYLPLNFLSVKYGYARDHLGWLARCGKVKAVRFGKYGQWFVQEESLKKYQSLKTASKVNVGYLPLRDLEKKYGYARDYIGWLARTGRIEAVRHGKHSQWHASEDSLKQYQSSLISPPKFSLTVETKTVAGSKPAAGILAVPLPAGTSSARLELANEVSNVLSDSRQPENGSGSIDLFYNEGSYNAEEPKRFSVFAHRFNAIQISLAILGGILFLHQYHPASLDLSKTYVIQSEKVRELQKETRASIADSIFTFLGKIKIGARDFLDIEPVTNTIIVEKTSSPAVRTITKEIVVYGNNSFSELDSIRSKLSETQLQVSSLNQRFDAFKNETPQFFQLPATNTAGIGNITLNPYHLSAEILDITGASTLSGNLSVDDDFTVDTNTLFVDSSNNRVGIGTKNLDTTFEVVGTASISDSLRVGNTITIGGTLTTEATFNATGSSSFGQRVTISKTPTSVHTGTWPNFTNTDDSMLFLKPASVAVADSNFFVIQDSTGINKFLIDAEGDVFANSLVLTGTTTQGTTNVSADLIVEGNTQLGDAVGDQIKFVGTLVPKTPTSIPLSIKASTSQSVDVFRIKDPDDNIFFTVDQGTGLLTASSGFNFALGNSTATVSYSRLGTATTGHTLSSFSDLLVSGSIETNGNAFFDSNASVSGNLTIRGSTALGDTDTDTVTFNAQVNSLLSFIGTGHAGLKLNNLTTAQRDLLTPASGMTLFNTSVTKMQVYNGTSWKNVGNPEIGAEVTSGTAGSVLFVDGSGNLAQDNTNFNFNDASDMLTIGGNLTLTKADPSIILNTTTAGDTDFWVGVTEDAGADDDDLFQIGDGTTPGTNPFLTINTSGNVGIGETNPGYKMQVVGGAYIWNGSGTGLTLSSNGSNALHVYEATGGNYGIYARGANAPAGLYGIMDVYHQSVFGAGAVNDGAFINFSANTAGSAKYNQGRVSAQWVNATDATRLSKISLWSADSLGYVEGLSVVSRGAGVADLLVNNGNVGIGTTTPTTKLEVQGTASASYGLFGTLQVAGFSSTSYSRFGTNSSSESHYISSSDDLLVSGDFEVDGSVSFAGPASISNTLYVSTLGKTGNVGIGTTGPTSKLYVSASGGTGDWATVIKQAGTGAYGLSVDCTACTTSTGYTLAAYTNAGTGLFVQNGGNVGIGTTAGSEWPTAPRLNILAPNTANAGLAVHGGSDGRIAYFGTQDLNSGTSAGTYLNISAGAGTGNTYITANVFSAGGAANNNLALQNSGGNVGIGTTGPGSKLEVFGGNLNLSGTGVAHGLTDVAPTNTFTSLREYGATNGGLQMYAISDTDTTALGITAIIGSTNPTDSTPAYVLQAGKSNGTTSWQALGASETAFQFKNFSTDLVTILGSGNVGIGTTGPNNLLHIQGNGASMRMDNTYDGGGGALGTALELYRTGTPADPYYIKTIRASATNSVSGLAFFRGATEDMRIVDGNVGIGDTGPDALLDVKGTVCLDLNADENCTDNTAAISDARLKTNVTNLTDGLFSIKQLRPVRFTWNGEYNTGTSNSLGFLAQEVESIFPELVITDTAGYKNLDYGKLTAVLTGAIQEQQSQIASLSFTIDQLASSSYQNLSSGDSYNISAIMSGVLSYFKDTLDIVFEKGLIRVKEMITDRFTTKMFCVEDVCIEKAQFKELLIKNGIISPEITPEATPEPTPATPEPSPEQEIPVSEPQAEVIPEITPEPTPETLPTPEPVIEITPTPESTPEPTPEPTVEIIPEIQP